MLGVARPVVEEDRRRMREMMRAEYYVRRRAKRARRMRTGPPPAPASGPEALRPEPCAEAVSARRPSASLSGVRPPRAIRARRSAHGCPDPAVAGGCRATTDVAMQNASNPPGRRGAAGPGVPRELELQDAVLTLPIQTLIKI